MTKVILGNHTAVFASRAEQDRIRRFYRDVLGAAARIETNEVDRWQLADVHFCFVWQDTALDPSHFLKAIYLELATDDVDAMRRKIVESGVKVIEIPDPHLYFQAPGGQVFKLVAIDEDLSVYEDSSSAKPGATATAA
ncbi:VOC family protein [Phenylobacterium hankyongense]|uniref:VOC family protein n=1 Tax=Phenylobacterium hankyongense TaxID=1813876 RepID=A0A328AW60_9CAUL|nr:VOC family protein [Phenylobacterium hankyongense]RAK58837.1 VOC family protein [Phenylobacterium hankyongense]